MLEWGQPAADVTLTDIHTIHAHGNREIEVSGQDLINPRIPSAAKFERIFVLKNPVNQSFFVICHKGLPANNSEKWDCHGARVRA